MHKKIDIGGTQLQLAVWGRLYGKECFGLPGLSNYERLVNQKAKP